MAKSTATFWDWLLAGVITGATVSIMQGILQGVFMAGFFGDSMLVRLIVNLLVSGASGVVAILLVDATGLLD
jgi:hypothetical protein